MPYSKHVYNKFGVISPDMQSATVDGYTFHINEIVPYTNTRSNIDYAKIEQFKKVDNGTIWFTGKSEKTKANVYYGLHCSLDLQREIDSR